MLFDNSLVQKKFENHTGHKQCREHTRCDAQHKNEGKAFYFFRSDPEKNRSSDKGGDVGIQDGSKCSLVAVSYSDSQRRAFLLLFADSLENKDVGINAHANG